MFQIPALIVSNLLKALKLMDLNYNMKIMFITEDHEQNSQQTPYVSHGCLKQMRAQQSKVHALVTQWDSLKLAKTNNNA